MADEHDDITLRGQFGSRLGALHAQATDLTPEHLEVMGMPRRLWQVKLGKIAEHTKARAVAERFSTHVNTVMAEGKPSLLLFYGDSLTGKSGAAAVLAKIASAYRYTTYYLDATSLLTAFRTDAPSQDEHYTVRERAYATDFLVLDNFGRGSSGTSAYVKEELESLLRYRQNQMKMTVVVTSLDNDELVQVYGQPFVDALYRNMDYIKCTMRWAEKTGDDL